MFKKANQKIIVLLNAPVDLNDSGRVDLLPMENLSPAIRWVSILGISSWFPKKYRKKVPAVSIVVVGIFVNAVALLSGSIGSFHSACNWIYISLES